MAVLIPSAGLAPALTPGPRADPRALSTGDDVARVGGAAFSALARIDDQNRATELRTARVAAAERLGALRGEYDQTADWSGLTARFEQDSARAADEIGAGLNPRTKAEFDLLYREMRAPHLAAMQTREFALRRDHERGQLSGAVDALVARTAGAADDGAAAALADQTADTIADARAAGWISAEEEQRLASNAAGSTAAAIAMRLMRENPAGLDARLAAGDFAALGPETVERFRASAQAEAARRDAADLAAVETERKAAIAALRDEASAAVSLIEAGLQPEGIEDLRARAAGTPAAPALETAVRAQQLAGGTFAVMTPAQQAEALTHFRRNPRIAGDEAVLASLERAHKATIEGVDADLLGHAARRGAADVAPLDLTDPANVAARVAQAEALAEQWAPGAPVRYFTRAEREAYGQRIRDAAPADQLALAVTLASGFGDRAMEAIGELGVDNPTFGHAGALVALTGDDRAARDILAGQRLLDAKEGAKPKAAVRAAAIAGLAAQATEGDDAMRAQLLAAADAHFAATGAAVDPADERGVADAYAASLQAAAGGVMQGGKLFGGLQDVNGRVVILPASVDADIVKGVFRAAAPEQLAAASLGGAPTWRGKPVDGPLGRVQLIYDGGGAYLVGRETADGVALLSDDAMDDGYFRLDLTKLAETVKPPPGWWTRATQGARRALGGQPEVAP